MSKHSLINWREWNQESFAVAQEKDLPILLNIFATWCRWCKMMDETSYSDEEVVELINRNFVPVRVDSDKRPDINQRYNAGGWPTTAFLTSTGKIITGGTYIAVDEMKQLLVTVSNTYAKNKDEVDERIAEREKERKEQRQKQGANSKSLSDIIVTNVISSIMMGFDEEYGGVGSKQKFPHPEMVDLLLHEYARMGKENLLRLATKTLDVMMESQMYDKVEGGFFRYSTERDWSSPNYEKLLGINSCICRSYIHAFQITNDIRYKETALGILKYVYTTLLDGEKGCFYGSQEANENYYTSKEREKLKPPPVDKTIYANWNAMMVSACLDAYTVFGNDYFRDFALKTLNFLLKTLLSDDGMVFHYYDGSPKLKGLLTDQVSVICALLDAHQVTMDNTYLQRAECITHNMIESLLDEETGAMFDKLPDANAQGRLSESETPIVENSLAADALIRLHYLTAADPAKTDSKYLDSARSILARFVPIYRRYSFLASSYAIAVNKLLTGPLQIDIIGSSSDSSTKEFLQAAAEIFDLGKVIRVLDTQSDRDKIAAAGYKTMKTVTAYARLGKTCTQSISHSKKLDDEIHKLIESSKAESTHAQKEERHEEEIPAEIVEKIGDIYQEATKYYRDTMRGGGLDWENKPPTYKEYPSALSTVKLPSPRRTGGLSIWSTISQRRSIRRYSEQPLSLRDLSQLLWATQGITSVRGGYSFRAAPSAGALYPIETYIVVNNVEDLALGVYHYNPREHCLEQIVSGDFRSGIVRAALDQSMAGRAAVVFVWTAVTQRSKWKYRQRAYRYIYLDAGHIGANLALAASAMGLGCCAIGALYDEEVNALLGVDAKDETVVYISAVGRVEEDGL